jgi:hypothetical protein
LWLSYDCEGDAARHKRQLKEWARLAGMRYDDRCALRTEASGRPSLVSVFAAEKRAPRGDEPLGEPYLLAGVS